MNWTEPVDLYYIDKIVKSVFRIPRFELATREYWFGISENQNPLRIEIG